jgi:hypothetical protein
MRTKNKLARYGQNQRYGYNNNNYYSNYITNGDSQTKKSPSKVVEITDDADSYQTTSGMISYFKIKLNHMMILI